MNQHLVKTSHLLRFFLFIQPKAEPEKPKDPEPEVEAEPESDESDLGKYMNLVFLV